MRLSLKGASTLMLALGLAGCSAAGSGPVVSTTPPPPVAAGAVVAPADMPEFCQNAAAGKYGAPPGNIETNNPVNRDFGYLVTGTADFGPHHLRLQLPLRYHRRVSQHRNLLKGLPGNALKRVASKRIQATRFKSLFLCMSLSRNRCTLLGDMH